MDRVARDHRPLPRSWPLLLSLLLIHACVAARGDEPAVDVSFTNDIAPILSKAGCNGGGCHGALAGKAGFRLSLFGYDPASDHLAITREALGRRVDLAKPATSLLLTKPTMAVPHKGGKRLDVGSDDYQLLASWIAAGCPGPQAGERSLASIRIEPAEALLAPGDEVAFQVTARYSDGSSRDVTRWARFTSTDATVASVSGDGLATALGHGSGAITAWFSSQIAVGRVTSAFPHAIPPETFAAAPRANLIDELVLEQLQRLRLAPSPPCDDATFLRRAFLDTIGRLPTPEEVRSFLSDTAPKKRERLVDLLLARPEFIDYWSYKWADIFLVTGSALRPAAVEAYASWIRDRVAENMPWDELVRQAITATGSSVENGATNFFAVHQDPETMAENTSQAFLSLSIGCAKCHNHPLEKWTNDQYYAFANLFARVRAKGWGGDARSGDGVRTLYVEPRGDLLQPRTGRPLPPRSTANPSIPKAPPTAARPSLPG